MKRFLTSVLLFSSTGLLAGSKIDARLAEVLRFLPPDETTVAWIFFTDKGSQEIYKSAVPRSVVSPRSFLRRLKARPTETAVDYTDLPVEQRYIEQLAAHGISIRQTSKWFNGASVRGTKEQLAQIEALPFVRSIELLSRFRRDRIEEQQEIPTLLSSQPSTSGLATNFDYGLSFGQLNQINVPAVHTMGNYGQGVIIGSFDNGFRLLNHEAFDTLRTRIVATYDFVDKKISVVPNNPDPSFGAHGIVTLSALAGFKPGELIGPAFGASFILARTENDSSETPIEEDYWVAAIEWADSIGVDVTSTSLGYLTYDPPYTSWTWEDMDGNTTVITRAADMAVSKGIVVCNSAGNNGFNAARNTLNAPADGDSVLSIGAVNADGNRASFSSMGPTTSTPPRIKPDVMAQGSSVRCARPTDPTQYTYSGGTSLSCPLAAGVAALLIHAKPTAGPLEIMNALKETASNASSPNNQMGWGILNAHHAITSVRGSGTAPGTFVLYPNYPNPFNSGTTIRYDIGESSHVTLTVYNLLGQQVRTLFSNPETQGVKTAFWDGATNSGISAATGTYFYRLVVITSSGTSYAETRNLTLLR
ncbi:MAG: S8 family serine peptidase [Bacteroidetes bacterium]|nr:S8 family serine peptidase [Bacteroidota bacterium]MCW5897218.1 S8 family serine peptidase [Bacteroidota bacterium]